MYVYMYEIDSLFLVLETAGDRTICTQGQSTSSVENIYSCSEIIILHCFKTLCTFWVDTNTFLLIQLITLIEKYKYINKADDFHLDFFSMWLSLQVVDLGLDSINTVLAMLKCKTRRG